MPRFWLSHILLCGLVALVLATPLSAQDGKPSSPAAPGATKNKSKPLMAPDLPIWSKWLNEDVVYIITDEERADFAKLETDAQRDQFVEDFWQRRNPNATPEWNPFKEEHYRRLAYANEQFAASIPGWKTDRGRIYIIYGPPDEREVHPANPNPILPPDASLFRRYRNEFWRYNFIQGLGRNIFFNFVDKCDCGKYELYQDPPRKKAPSGKKSNLIPVTTIVDGAWKKWLNEDVRWIITDEERFEFKALTSDQERDDFITAFWERRNPSPGSPENKFKEKHYRRIAFASAHYGVSRSIPGWKSDRGRICVMFGQPTHITYDVLAGGPNDSRQIPIEREVWRYDYLEDVGHNVVVTFASTCWCDDFRMIKDVSDPRDWPQSNFMNLPSLW